MSRLSPTGQAILRELLKHIATGRVIPNRPDTFAGYKQIHDALNLPRRAETMGDSLKVQGLADLAEWTKRDGHPAITGLIVDQTSLMPGHGYFEIFERSQDDFPWWAEQVALALAYDWGPFLATELPPPPPPTQEAADLAEPTPERFATTTYRILRDTELARRVTSLHRFECQVCGHTIEVPDGSRYAEAHHIQPLGQPHNGPDVIGNILCLCPNHHAEFDLGVSAIDLSAIRCCDGHEVNQKYVDYHNQNVHKGRRR